MKILNLKPEERVAALYAIFGGLWILFSDTLLDALIADRTLYTRMQTYKGWFFVAASAVLIYSLIKQENNKRAATAEKLRASEDALRRFELLAQNSRDIILFMRREDGRILEANAAAVQAYGYSREELMALTVQDLRAPNTQGLTADQMAQADAGGILFETVHIRKDGSTFPVEVSSQGATIGGMRTLVSIVRDITERKQAENELRQTAEELDKRTRELNAILSSVQDFVYIFDPEGRFVFANKKLLDLWGLTAEQTLGKTMHDLNYPKEVETVFLEGIQHVLKTGQTVTNITHYTSPTGAIGSYENILAPMLGSDSRVIFIAGSSRDISERERVEQEIASLSKFPTENPNPVLRVQSDGELTYANAASRELLEMWGCGINGYLPADVRSLLTETVASGLGKTVDVPCNDKVYSLMLFPIPEGGYVNLYGRDITERVRAEAELKRTLEELRYSNAELEQFAYVASHDLQEPLRGIAGLAQLLGQRYQGQLDSRADEYITLIVEGTQRMQTLINDLLAYSRIGRRGEAIQSTSAEGALQAALGNLNMAIREYGATITNESLPKVKADATQLVQVFQNLVGNAIKFRADRPAVIHIGVADARDFWQFSIRDNGIGIEPQYFERIFQVFQRLHTRREYKGTGIGLAICKKIIERHGGRIWVESQVGVGSTFYFILPKGD